MFRSGKLFAGRRWLPAGKVDGETGLGAQVLGLGPQLLGLRAAEQIACNVPTGTYVRYVPTGTLCASNFVRMDGYVQLPLNRTKDGGCGPPANVSPTWRRTGTRRR